MCSTLLALISCNAALNSGSDMLYNIHAVLCNVKLHSGEGGGRTHMGSRWKREAMCTYRQTRSNARGGIKSIMGEEREVRN